MKTKLYGNLMNRLEEGRQFVPEIKVGDGVTEYFYSDRKPYEVIEVRDQKHITIRKMDHKHIGEAFENKWELISNENNPVYDLEKRGEVWYFTNTWTWDEIKDRLSDIEFQIRLALGGFDAEKIQQKGKQTKRVKANISIGRADYYCLRPAWSAFRSSGSGMAGVYSGSYVLFPSDVNYATGEAASSDPIEIREYDDRKDVIA